MRDIARLNERDSWPLIRRDRTGIASQFGELTGIEGLGTPRHLEVMPYAVTKNVTTTTPALVYGHQQQLTGGADIKYGVTSNFTLDATVNPDFGQVESDPAVLNLSAFETFYQEKRPFFIEGTGIFRFDLQCHMARATISSIRGASAAPRRSRTPPRTALLPAYTSILGAAKLTGRTQHGLSVGVLEAATQREVGLARPDARAASELRGRACAAGARPRQHGKYRRDVHRRESHSSMTFAADSLRRTAYVGGSISAATSITTIIAFPAISRRAR